MHTDALRYALSPHNCSIRPAGRAVRFTSARLRTLSSLWGLSHSRRSRESVDWGSRQPARIPPVQAELCRVEKKL